MIPKPEPGANLIELISQVMDELEKNPEIQRDFMNEKERLIRAAHLKGDKEFYNAQRQFFLSFKEHSNQKPTIASLLKKRIPNFLPTEGTYLKFLDIGPGDGDISLPFFHMFKNKNTDFVIHEPSLGMSARFLMNYMIDGQNFRRLHLYNNQKQEKLKSSPEEFNFILASHVLYYVPDLENSVQAIYDSLAPGGVASIVLTKKHGFFHSIRDKFKGHFTDQNLTSQDVCNILDSKKIDYEKEDLTSHLDVTDCICEMDPRDYTHLTIHGKNLICFMLRTDYSFAENDDKYEIVRFIRDHSSTRDGDVPENLACDGPHMNCRQGHTLYYKPNNCPRRFAQITDEVIWIRKPGEYTLRDIDAKHRGLDEFGEKDITVGEIKEFFREPIKEYIEKDLKGMEEGLKEAYISFLILDFFLGEPFYYQIVWEDHPLQPRLFERDGEKFYGPTSADNLRIVTEKTSLHRIDSDEDVDIRKIWNKDGRHHHCIEYLDDALDATQTHFSEESREALGRTRFSQLVGALYRKFKHHEVISVDGFSQYGELVQQNPHIFNVNLEKFIHP